MGLLDWIAPISALVAVIALVLTGKQVSLARRQTDLQERVHRDQQQPYVWVDYRMDPVSNWLVDLVIKNEGPTVARNVQVSFDKPISRAGNFNDLELMGLPGFTKGFASIPPGREMRWSLGSHVDIFEEKTLARHEVTVTFDGPFGRVDPVIYTLDYADMKSAALRDAGTLKEVAKSLKELTKKLG